MRVTQSMAKSSILGDMMVARGNKLRALDQVSTGKKISKLSDDPAAAVDALRTRRALQRAQAYESQSTDAKGWLETYDSTLGNISDRLMRVRELAIQASNTGTTSGVTADTLADEISAIRTELIGITGTKYLGKPVFSGTSATTPVYDSAGVYSGDSGQYLRTVAPGVTMQVNVTGAQAFGVDGSGTQLFDVLADLETQVRSGSNAGIASASGNLDVARERVETARIEVGVRYNTVDQLGVQRQDTLDSLKRQLSDVEDIDFEEAAINLTSAETAYQATLSAAARLFNTSLVDYLR